MVVKGHYAITVHESEAGVYLQFLTRSDGRWTVVCGTGLIARASLYELQMVPKSEDPMIRVRNRVYRPGSAPSGRIETFSFFDTVAVDAAHGSVTLEKEFLNQTLTQTYTLTGRGVSALLSMDVTGVLELEELTSNVYFIPEQRSDRQVEPLDFAWLPNLHRHADHVCGDHFFRSPAAAVAFEGYYASLIPDLDLMRRHRGDTPYALDLRIIETEVEAPRLTYGVCPWTVDGHVYTAHRPGMTHVARRQRICFGFDLLFGAETDYRRVPGIVGEFLWQRYGRRCLPDPRPQVLPFAEYGRRYTYVHEMPAVLEEVTIDGERCAGLHNVDRRGANFHAWENDLHVAFGISHYGRKWGRDDLVAAADGIINLFNRSPRNRGAFRCIYNFERACYEGTLYWTGRVADSLTCYDSAAMGVSTWWSLLHHELLGEMPHTLENATGYGRFLTRAQLPNGAIPTWFFRDLSPVKQLRESATTCISGAVLARLASVLGSDEFHGAAVRAATWVVQNTVEQLNFDDFELFYSCARKALNPIDMWSGIRPQNTLSLQWACDFMLALQRTTGEPEYLEYGEYLLGILALYQQVWDPVFYPDEYLFGGFCSQNTDGEWNDGRQCRFVSTFADYYRATGNLHYLERAVAACRAGFALMDMAQNHANGINRLRAHDGHFFPNGAGKNGAQPGQGYAPECIHHGLDYDPAGVRAAGWSGMNWSSGGALAAAAYLELLFGALHVDLGRRSVTPIDGVAVNDVRWSTNQVELVLSSSLQSLPVPYTEPRNITITLEPTSVPVTVRANGQQLTVAPDAGRRSFEVTL